MREFELPHNASKINWALGLDGMLIAHAAQTCTESQTSCVQYVYADFRGYRLTVFTPHPHTPRPNVWIAREAVLWFCVLLLSVLTVAQVAHIHRDATKADQCAICMALHSAAAPSAAIEAILLVPFEWIAPATGAYVLRFREQETNFIRPPPDSLGISPA